MFLTRPQSFVAPDDRDFSAYPFATRKALALAARLQVGRLTVTMPDAHGFSFGAGQLGPQAHILIRDHRFAMRLAAEGEVGAAESYLRGEWDTPDLTKVIELLSLNHAVIENLLRDRPFTRLRQLFAHWLNRNTKTGSRRNIAAHYDLGNPFYASWLDRTMTYSSAVFASPGEDLASGQARKYRELASRIALSANDHVLEIGCGWGGFAEYAARETGCRVTAITISQAQYEFARERIFRAGLAEKVSVELRDYRDETGLYDKIASIEMFEAVGEAFWPGYFRQLRDRLRPGGLAGLQVITIKETVFAHYRREIDFIRRYIFPGGMLPTFSILRDMGVRHGLPLTTDFHFGQDYARTLVQWREGFRSAWPLLTRQGFDERFRRMWEFYLAYCEAGFRTGQIDVSQMVFAKLS